MQRKNYDVLVLGSGPAGQTVATRAARAGKSVALVERRKVGGTCALRGCNPKKVVANAAALVDFARRADEKLVALEGIDLDWPTLRAFVHEFTDPVEKGTQESLASKGVDVIEATPRFVGEREIELDDGRRLSADAVVLAVGARPRPLNIEGGELATTNDEFFDLEELPERVAFLGGGYVSFELAHVAARARCEVTIVDRGERPLEAFDPDLVDELVARTKELGVELVQGFEAEAIRRVDGRLMLRNAGGDELGPFDLVVHGAGRIPNLDDLHLDSAGIAATDVGIVVDERLRSTTAKGVYACGDCAALDEAPLTPVASASAAHVVHELLEPDGASFQPGPVPSVAFTTPPLAAVGMSEEEARRAVPDVHVEETDMSSWGGVRKVVESAARAKVLVDPSSRLVLGAHLLGPGADETINVFAIAMRAGMTVDEFEDVVFAFPTHAHSARSLVPA